MRRYGNENVDEVVDMSETVEEVLDLLPSHGKQGWSRIECFKVEKGLLMYG